MPPVYGNSMEVLRELVRSVVREELQKQRLDQNAPMISSLADVIREEVRQAVREPQLNTQPELPLQQQPRMSYADALLRGPPGRVDVAAATPMQHPMSIHHSYFDVLVQLPPARGFILTSTLQP
ncbi:hypothetical protein HPB52_022424 [Rhipicephalus sanguineus]|uniref:Uncharacterized protein n=1 Tax=Rhipicephalus sanguineus TaxID=34632 RepID=A0A9D4Q3J5_RHISA|nr:hypothetical protein HPB52_022424 [Rhipicephalus sanguineus]